MELRPEFVVLVLACAAVTAVPRVLPLVFLARIVLPGWLLAWLGYVPLAVLSALLAIEVGLVDGQPAYASNPALWAIVPALAVAAWSRSLILTVLVGVGIYRALL